MTLGEKIAYLRKSKGLSQEQLAQQLNVTRQTISKWELNQSEPDIDLLRKLSLIFNISIDCMVNEAKDISNTMETISLVSDTNIRAANTQRRKMAIKRCSVIVLTVMISIFVALGICDLVGRSIILSPDGYDHSIAITKKEVIRINPAISSGKNAFSQDGKPTVCCIIPQKYVEDEQINGLYKSDDGAYIKINSDFEENVFNPLYGTDYFAVYEQKGYDSYIEMMAYSIYDIGGISIFSSKENIYLAGGAKIIRSQMCAGQDADGYIIDGGLSDDGERTIMYGIALCFDESVWLITLKDFNGNYYYFTINDPNGVGESTESIATFLNSVAVVE